MTQPTPEQMERAEKLYREHRTTGWDGADVPAAIVAAILQSDQQQAELKAHAEVLEGILAEFIEVNDDPCRYDHHGYCQAHFLEEDCLVKRARTTLKEQHQ